MARERPAPLSAQALGACQPLPQAQHPGAAGADPGAERHAAAFGSVQSELAQAAGLHTVHPLDSDRPPSVSWREQGTRGRQRGAGKERAPQGRAQGGHASSTSPAGDRARRSLTYRTHSTSPHARSGEPRQELLTGAWLGWDQPMGCPRPSRWRRAMPVNSLSILLFPRSKSLI